MSTDDLLDELYRIAAEVNQLFTFNAADFLRALDALGDSISELFSALSTADLGDTANFDEWAAEWKTRANYLGSAAEQADLVRIDIDKAWDGLASNNACSTLRRYDSRLSDAQENATTRSTCFVTLSEDISAAEKTLDEAQDLLHGVANSGLVMPWQLPGLIQDVLSAISLAQKACEAADTAYETWRTSIQAIDDSEAFPALGPGLGAIDSMNMHSGTPYEVFVLTGDGSDRARDAYEAMSDADKIRYDALIAAASSEEHRAWLTAALAAGHPIATLESFGSQIGQFDDSALRERMDPTKTTLQQQSGSTCGSASLIYARMLRDPAFALWILSGYDSETGTQDNRDPHERFAEAELEVKARTNSGTHIPGVTPFPWPHDAGTSPLGAGRELTDIVGSDAGVDLVFGNNPENLGNTFDSIRQSVDAGNPVTLYVGDDTAPTHIVLVTGATPTTLTIYEPGAGTNVTVSREDVMANNLGLGPSVTNGDLDRLWLTVGAG